MKNPGSLLCLGLAMILAGGLAVPGAAIAKPKGDKKAEKLLKKAFDGKLKPKEKAALRKGDFLHVREGRGGENPRPGRRSFDMVRDYVKGHRHDHGARSLPPGLAKKIARGGELPPGWRKKVAPGRHVSDGLLAYAVSIDRSVVPGLTAPAADYAIYAIGDRVVQLERESRLIVDTFDLH